MTDSMASARSAERADPSGRVSGLAFHRARKPEARGAVNERFHLRGHVPVTRRRAKQHAVGFTKIVESADLNVLTMRL